MQDIWDSCMAAWQVLGGPYWICRSRSGGFWGKTKVLRISRLWLVQTASGSTAIRRMYWTQFQFKMVQGIYPNLSKSVAFTITLRCCEPERLANTTSTQLDAAYFPSCTCFLHTTKLDQSQQVLSEATFMMKIQLGWPLRAIIGDPFCISSVPYYSFRLFPLRCHPSQQTLRPEPRDHQISQAWWRSNQQKKTAKSEEFMKALCLTTWVSLCVVASGLPGWTDFKFMKWGSDGVGERWDLTDGHAHDVTLGKTGGASPKYAE